MLTALTIFLYLLAAAVAFGGFLYLFQRNETVIWLTLWSFAIFGLPIAALYGLIKKYGTTEGYSEFYFYSFFFGSIVVLIGFIVGVVLLVINGYLPGL